MNSNNAPSDQSIPDEESTFRLNRTTEVRSDGGVTIDSEVDGTDANNWQLNIKNLGGVGNANLSIQPGITALVGRNATNRTSVFRALAAVLGGQESAAKLKSDANSGFVELTIGEDTYKQEYAKEDNLVQVQGEPYSNNSTLVDSFVALFVDSPARRAVERGDNLREILMEPVDTDEIRNRIAELKQERTELDKTIKKAEKRKRELPKLEEKRADVQKELNSVENEISELESVVENLDVNEEDDDEKSELHSELESLRSDLSSLEKRKDEIEQQIEFRKDKREELVDERANLKSTLEEFDNSAELRNKIDDLAKDVERLSDKRTRLTQAAEDLQSVIQANEKLLEGNIEIAGFLERDTVTDALDPDSQTVECWTCGTEVDQGDISNRIDSLRDITKQHRSEIDELEARISNLRQEKKSYESELNEYEQNTQRVEELENRIDQHEEQLQDLKDDRETIEEEISGLEEEIASVETELEQQEDDDDNETNEFVDAHKELTQLERERGSLENKLEDINKQIEEIEILDEDRASAEEQREEITAELENLRGRIEELEKELVDTLNSIMDDLIDRLEYRNISRVWVERRKTETDSESSFELHIVRETEDQAAYEDTVDTLSESEREVIGLIVSLAGYLAHDVDQKIPFLFLDSVEMIDGKRLAKLLEYIKLQTDVSYLCVALLPKDARSVEEVADFDSYNRIDFETLPS